ncbi:MAG TPA: RNase adaptor protein RapZ, partial [Gammaproteobacteria bacterium]|nr:RNase adaptor protein RapZ [Gammaproteobacteria bacterium]
SQTGLDTEVIQFLEKDARCLTFFAKLKDFIAGVLCDFDQSDRSYMTIAIGCTGGQHRSVYLTEKLHRDLITQFPAAQIRHRDLREAGS